MLHTEHVLSLWFKKEIIQLQKELGTAACSGHRVMSLEGYVYLKMYHMSEIIFAGQYNNLGREVLLFL